MSILGITGTRLTVATSFALAIAFDSSGFAASGPTSGKDAKEKGSEFQKGDAPVNGLRIYYEIQGAASPAYPPIVVPHGGGDTIQTSFGRRTAGAGTQPAGDRIRAAGVRLYC